MAKFIVSKRRRNQKGGSSNISQSKTLESLRHELLLAYELTDFANRLVRKACIKSYKLRASDDDASITEST